jgi:ATP phosphoribosyltransferase regulatory subunit
VGFSLYVDGLVDLGLGQDHPRRVLLPAGTPASVGALLRGEGWITVAALDQDNAATFDDCAVTAARMRCGHIFANGAVQPV